MHNVTYWDESSLHALSECISILLMVRISLLDSAHPEQDLGASSVISSHNLSHFVTTMAHDILSQPIMPWQSTKSKALLPTTYSLIQWCKYTQYEANIAPNNTRSHSALLQVRSRRITILRSDVTSYRISEVALFVHIDGLPTEFWTYNVKSIFSHEILFWYCAEVCRIAFAKPVGNNGTS